jgi:hypothetical protein
MTDQFAPFEINSRVMSVEGDKRKFPAVWAPRVSTSSRTRHWFGDVAGTIDAAGATSLFLNVKIAIEKATIQTARLRADASS